jgi:hypothetical protein
MIVINTKNIEINSYWSMHMVASYVRTSKDRDS